MDKHLEVLPLGDSFGHLITTTARMLRHYLLRSFKENGFDITPEQWPVLAKLWEKNGIHPSELARLLGKDRHSMTRILQVMEKRGLIEKKQNQQDVRKCHIFLTDKGWNLKDQLLPVVRRATESAFRSVSMDEYEHVRNILMQIQQNIAE